MCAAARSPQGGSAGELREDNGGAPRYAVGSPVETNSGWSSTRSQVPSG